MKPLRIVPYKPNSRGARLLAQKLTETLGYKVWRGKPKINQINLCWGYSKPVTEYDLEHFINFPEVVSYSRDKRYTFQALEKAGVPHVPYTTTKEVAKAWQEAGKTVFARTACGQGGSGIQVVEPADELPEADLYTQYVKKSKEFRVHVFKDNAILVQEKRKKSGVGADYLIRSHNNGWVFCLKDIVEPDGLRVLGVNAIRALGLDFGAVDIIWNKLNDSLYVLEVNSAPGLCNTTVEVYANAICEAL